MRVYLCGDTAHDLDSRRNQVRLNVANDGKEEGFQESRKGRGREYSTIKVFKKKLLAGLLHVTMP